MVPGNAWRGVLGTSVLQAFHALSLAQYPRKLSKEPTLQKIRLNHLQTGDWLGGCQFSTVSYPCCPRREAHPERGTQLAERAHGIF